MLGLCTDLGATARARRRHARGPQRQRFSFLLCRRAREAALGGVRLSSPFRPPLVLLDRLRAAMGDFLVDVWLSGGVQEALLAAFVAGRLPHTFLEASGVHCGSHFGFKNGRCLSFCPGPVGSFFELTFHRCLLRVPSEI